MPADSERLSVALHRIEIIVRGLAFWAAIVLPMVYLPLFVAGSSRVEDPTVIGTLVLLNALAIVVGHDYEGEVRDEFGRLR